MSDRPTPETDAQIEGQVIKAIQVVQHGAMVPIVNAGFARRLERQRDAAVEALNNIRKISWPVEMCVDEYARAVLREIEEGKS